MSKMKLHKWSEIKARTLSPEQQLRARVAASKDIVEMSLRRMREVSGKTQEEVANVMEKTQSELSRLERRNDLLLSTIRAYVEALGGHLEVRAVFDDSTVVINQLIAADS
jgi:predicted transcriptional regulator